MTQVSTTFSFDVFVSIDLTRIGRSMNTLTFFVSISVMTFLILYVFLLKLKINH